MPANRMNRDEFYAAMARHDDARLREILWTVAMATQVYLIMYVLMFIAAIRLRRSQPDRPRGYRAPALGPLCLLGAVSSVAALLIGFIPPSQFGHSNPLTYAVLILAGILAIGTLPPLLMDRLRKPGWKAAGDGGERRT